MSYDAPDLSQILSNEETMNNRLISLKSQLQNILDDNTISYGFDEGIIPLIRKLPYPVPTNIVWNNRLSWLTKSGPQTSNKSCACYPVVRDQNGNSILNMAITVRRKPISGGNWSIYGNYTVGNSFNLTADSNNGGYIYECYPTDYPSISAQLTLPQYYFNYDGANIYHAYDYLNVLDTSNLLLSDNVRSISTSYLSYGMNYFDIIADGDGEMLVAIPLKNTPTILGASSTTNIYIAYDITRGSIESNSVINGVGGGMVGNGSRNSMGIFLDASDADLMSTYSSSFSYKQDCGYTVSGSSSECVVRIPGGSSGAYTWFENNNGSISNYGPYWYGSMLGNTYAPCVVVYNSNMNAGESLRVTIKYIRAVSP